MGHTCLPTQKRSDKDHRPQIKRLAVKKAGETVRRKLLDRLDKDKGWGAWLSRHEILGFLTEEYIETVEAVHDGAMVDVRRELIDVAVGCIFAIACIDSDSLDW